MTPAWLGASATVARRVLLRTDDQLRAKRLVFGVVTAIRLVSGLKVCETSAESIAHSFGAASILLTKK